MLRIFSCRASVDRDGFLFRNIGKQLDEGKSGRRIFLVVPNQYTLQAERNAFDHLGAGGLMTLEVLSLARLGERILEEAGGSGIKPVDKYGRHMLLARIIREKESSFCAFGGLSGKQSFISMVNDLISEFKQYNTRPEDLADILDQIDEKAILRRKLSDILIIFEKYEDLIRNRYIDTEDHLDLIISKIEKASAIRGAEIWIDGFESFTPKTLAVLEKLMLHAANLNVILTCSQDAGGSSAKGDAADHAAAWQHDAAGQRFAGDRDSDIFELTALMSSRLRQIAEKNGIAHWTEQISEAQAPLDPCAAIRHIERELFAYPYNKYQGNEEDPGIEICRCANHYAEAETVAVKITELVRERGMRYRDMLVICSDMEARGPVLKRIMDEYGIPCFMDRKRGVIHNPCVEYILALLDIIGKGWRFEDVFRLVRTGLSPVSSDDGEDLENYAYKYRIRGGRWKSEFKYGAAEIGVSGMEGLNAARESLVGLISGFESAFRRADTGGAKTRLLYDFLKDAAGIPDRAEQLTAFLRDSKRHEYAEETSQIWDVIIAILDQIVELSGDEAMTHEEYNLMLRTGLEAVEIGLLPPTLDQVLVGTLQRTRPGRIKALFVIGANDGSFPAAVGTEGILNDDEKAVLLSKNIEICKHDELRAREEKLAIYKVLSKPSDYLWIGYSAADQDGKELKPSLILGRLKKIFPAIREQKDILNSGDPIRLIGSRNGTLRHLSEELRSGREKASISAEWKAAYRWFAGQAGSDTDPEAAGIGERLRIIRQGASFDNRMESLSPASIRRLYGRDDGGDIEVSPSRIERFSKCPFSYFINYGLRADERRILEIAGREIGDICHECLMKLGNELTKENIGVTDPDSPWMTITQTDCEALVSGILKDSAQNYSDGLLTDGEAEMYRQDRIRKICSKTAWMLIEHVRHGSIKKMLFETAFRNGDPAALPPIRVETADGAVTIAGKIDRIDILEGDKEYVKIIDYKTGYERFDINEARGGWRLQLMLYLKAASDALSAEPAGVFYFYIDDPMLDAVVPPGAGEDQLRAAGESLAAQLRKRYKMDGVVVSDPNVVKSIDNDFTGYSEIIPVSMKGDGTISGSEGRLLTPEAFRELQSAVGETVEKLCGSLLSGCIDAAPKRLRDGTSACKYCLYRSICTFDLAFEGCRYVKV